MSEVQKTGETIFLKGTRKDPGWVPASRKEAEQAQPQTKRKGKTAQKKKKKQKNND